VRMATADKGETRVLARLDDGEPLLVMRKVEQGNVLMLGIDVHTGWTNLPLRPIFLPLIDRLTFELSGVEQAHHTVLAGAPLELKFETATRPIGVEVVTPAGETMRLTTSPHPSPLPKGEGTNEKGQIFRYADTYDIGIYLLRLLESARAAPIAYAVNVDPEEFNPATIDREELQKDFAKTPLIFADNPDDLSATFAWLREGKSLWGLFLTVVLIGLVFETFASNLLTAKNT
jgi:hypothetical protein